jgi:predicted ABC-type sugar transport system permease subunit
MENPRKVDGLIYGSLIALFIVATCLAFLTFDIHPLLVALAALIGFAVICIIGALINIAIFPPLFRLLAKFTRISRKKL